MYKDEFQERYINYQERKKDIEGNTEHTPTNYKTMDWLVFKAVMETRRSQRSFKKGHIEEDVFNEILESARVAPSSCNRQAIYIKETDTEFAERMLVGARGWIKGADRVLLLFGDKIAYKSPAEKDFMPFLDAGFVGQNMYLMCEVLGVGCCFVNPNIIEENKKEFVEKYGDDYFCGAIALGRYDKKQKPNKLRDLSKVMRK